MSAPFFSVLLPVYNARNTVIRAINSVRAQSFSDWELIIVDDGSTDDSLLQIKGVVGECVQTDQRIKLYARPHQGVAATRAFAMQEARGFYWIRLDADDEWLSQAFERIHAFAQDHPDAQLISTNGYQVFAKNKQIPYYAQPRFQTVFSLTITDMLQGNMIGTSTVATPAVYDLIGPPRSELYSEDPDQWLRAVAMGAKHYHVPEALHLYYQDNKKSLSKNVRKMWQSHIKIYTDLRDKKVLSTPLDRSLATRRIWLIRCKLLLHWNLWGLPLQKRRMRCHQVQAFRPLIDKVNAR